MASELPIRIENSGDSIQNKEVLAFGIAENHETCARAVMSFCADS